MEKWPLYFRLGAIIIALVSIVLVPVSIVKADDGDSAQGSFTVALAISNIKVSNVATSAATVSWKTNAAATSQIFYDTAAHDNVTAYTRQTTESLSLVQTHSVSLTGLTSSTTYHYRIKSRISDTDFVAISQDLTFTTLTPSAPPSGGGGAPSYTIETNLLGSEQTKYISYSGKVLQTIEATSPDNNLSITLSKGSTALGPDGKRLRTLNVNSYVDPPDPPEEAYIIGLPYDFQPNGATFEDPPMVLTWHYDPDTLGDIPEDNLVLAYYDDDAGVWVELECEVDTENNTITAKVTHFTLFVLLGKVPPPPPPAPAEFAASGLVVSPGEVYVGESVSIRILVANTGGESGSCNVTLKINGTVEELKEITVSAGLSKEVTFSVSKTKAATYAVDVNGLTGSFTVKEKPEPPPVPIPAEFAVSDLVISPGELYVGEPVTIEVLVANTGGESGSYEVSFKINGAAVIEAREVTLSPGSSQKVSLSTIRGDAGTFAVDVNGLTGSFTVKKKPEEVVPAPWYQILTDYWGVWVAGICVIIAILLIVTRRRKSQKKGPEI